MACFYPLKGYRSPDGGKLKFSFREGQYDRHVTVPCGQCVGCRLERSRQWAVRMTHEAQMHQDNCFITLTYSPDNLPLYGSLVLEDWQKFAKKLRYHCGPYRFFMCGEYGENYGRPHYHACIFGKDFQDKKLYKISPNGDRYYTSDILSSVWGLGHCIIGDVTFQSAAYVARYIMKKQTGKNAAVYDRVDPSTGEIHSLKPEFTTMSRNGGIGLSWLKKFKSDVYPHDRVIMNGVKFRPPRFYDGQFEIDHPAEFQSIRARRVRRSKKHSENNTDTRLRVREEVQQARAKRLKREIE